MVQLVSIPDGGQNITNGFIGPSLWSVVEVNLSLVCASVPALKPFVVWYFGKYFPRWTSSGRGSYGHGGRHASGSGAIELSKHNQASVVKSQHSARHKSLFHKGSTASTTEITANHDEERVSYQNIDFLNLNSSQDSINADIGQRQDLRIVKTSNVRVHSTRIMDPKDFPTFG